MDRLDRTLGSGVSGLLRRCLAQLKDPMVLVLLAAAALSWFAGGGRDWLDAAIILVIVTVNTVISVAQEDNARKALEALDRLSAPRAKVIREVTCGVEGYAAAMDTMALGTAAQAMGAGRLRKEDPIDYSVGFILRVRLGDHVFPGTPLCELHARSEEEADAAEAAVRAAIRWSGTPCEGGKNFYALVTPEGIREL